MEKLGISIFRNALITGLITAASMAAAQSVQYTEYLGDIVVNQPILPLAADESGRLFYGTFNGPNSKLFMIEDPEAQTGLPSAATTVIQDFPEFPAQRGLQSIQVTSENDLLVAGDTGDTNAANVWKFDWDETGMTFTPDVAFSTNAATHPARRSAVSIYSENPGDGVMIVNGLNNIDFFDFSGFHLAGPFRVSDNYMRESVYNNQDNVYYIIRNGQGAQDLIRNYITNVDPNAQNGGTLTTNTLIADGASNGLFGGARQNAYYFEEQNQLITLDGDVVLDSTPVPPTVRVWNILDSGTSLSLAYRIEGTADETQFTSLSDAVILNDRLYVSSSGTGKIYVFGPAPASVSTWARYEDIDNEE